VTRAEAVDRDKGARPYRLTDLDGCIDGLLVAKTTMPCPRPFGARALIGMIGRHTPVIGTPRTASSVPPAWPRP